MLHDLNSKRIVQNIPLRREVLKDFQLLRESVTNCSIIKEGRYRTFIILMHLKYS